jgi:hypothetical protein
MKWFLFLSTCLVSAQTMVRPEQIRDWNQIGYADAFSSPIASVPGQIYNPISHLPPESYSSGSTQSIVPPTTRVVLSQVVVFGLSFTANFAPITNPVVPPCTPTPGYLSCVTLNTVEIDIYSFAQFQQSPPPTGTTYSQDVVTVSNFPPCATDTSLNCTQCTLCVLPSVIRVK